MAKSVIVVTTETQTERGRVVSIIRSVCLNGQLVYMDRKEGRAVLYHSVDMDLFAHLNGFCLGHCGLYVWEHGADRRKNRNYFIKLFQSVRFQLKTQKLKLGIKFFKFRQKYKFLCFKSAP